MPTLTADPTALSAVIRVSGAGHTPLVIRHQSELPESRALSLTVGGGFAGVAALVVVSGGGWITLPDPPEASNGVPVTIVLNAANLKPGRYGGIVQAAKDGYDTANIYAALSVQPMGPMPKSRRART